MDYLFRDFLPQPLKIDKLQALSFCFYQIIFIGIIVISSIIIEEALFNIKKNYLLNQLSIKSIKDQRIKIKVQNYIQLKAAINQMEFRNLTHSNLRRTLFEQITQQQYRSKFSKLCLISSGTQGKVFKADFNGQKVAIKQFKNANANEYFRYIASEIITLNELCHQNIIKLINCYKVQQTQIQNSSKYYMVMEFCEASLNDYTLLANLNTKQKLYICRQIVSAIQLAHQNNIMHRDIKPENVLLKNVENLQIKVCDFGCSRRDFQGVEDLSKTCQIGTPLYKDPNVQNGDYTNKCDVYSLGLLIMYIFFGKTIFSIATTKAQLRQLQISFQNNQNIDSYFQLETQNKNQEQKQIVKSILKHTLTQNEKKRYSCLQLLQQIQKIIDKPRCNASKKVSQKQLQKQVSGPTFKKKKTDQTQNIYVQSFDVSKIQRVSVQYAQIKQKVQHKSNILQQNEAIQCQLKKSYHSQKGEISKSTISNSAQNIKENTTQSSLNNEQPQLFVQRFTVTGQQGQNQQDQKDSQILKENIQHQQRKNIQKDIEKKDNESSFQLQNILKKINLKNQQQNLKNNCDETRDQSFISNQLMRSLVNPKQCPKNISFISLNAEQKVNSSDKMIANLIQYFNCIDHKQSLLSFQTRLFKLVHNNKKTFNNIKPLLESITFLNHETKEGLAFMYHLLYSQFLQNMICFFNKKYSTIWRKIINDQNFSFEDISGLGPKFIKLVDKQKVRINAFMIKTGKTLEPRVRLIQPKLTDYMVKQIRSIGILSGNEIAGIDQGELKQQIKYFIDQRIQKVISNQKEADKVKSLFHILKEFK